MGDDNKLGSLFVNPIILLPKPGYVKLVIDARYLLPITDLTNYSWLLEPVKMIMTRINGKYFPASDLSFAYHQVPLSEETQKLSSWILRTRWTSPIGQQNEGNQFRTSEKEISHHLFWCQPTPITYLRWSVHHYTRISPTSTEKRTWSTADKTHFLRKVKFLEQFISQERMKPVAKRVCKIWKI